MRDNDHNSTTHKIRGILLMLACAAVLFLLAGCGKQKDVAEITSQKQFNDPKYKIGVPSAPVCLEVFRTSAKRSGYQRDYSLNLKIF